MRAAVIRRRGGPDELVLAEVPDTEPGPTEITVSVAAAAVNPVDLKTRSGFLVNDDHHFPLVLGWDVSGTVVAVGPDVTEFRPGDAVFGAVSQYRRGQGTYAERVTAPVSLFAAAPTSVELAHAAAMPLSGLTALVALRTVAPGSSILVVGAHGSVGFCVAAIAVAQGHRVSVLVRAAHAVAVAGLGADAVHTDLDAIPRRSVDVVVDTVGVDAIDTVGHGGQYIAISDVPPPTAARDIAVFKAEVAEDGAALIEIARMVDDATLPVRIHRSFALADAAAAHAAHERGGLTGKILLTPPDQGDGR